MACIASIRDERDSESAWMALVRATAKLLERDPDRQPWAMVALVRTRGVLGRRWRELHVVRAPTADQLRRSVAYWANLEPVVDVYLVGVAPGVKAESILAD